jgi:hypothetical protein
VSAFTRVFDALLLAHDGRESYRPKVGGCGASTPGAAGSAGNGSLRTSAAGLGNPSTSRTAGSAASAMAACPSEVG